MKKTLSLMLMLLSVWSFMHSQNDYRDPSDDPQPDFSLFFTLGNRPMRLGSSDIYFRYVDESPSADNMVANLHLHEDANAFGVKLGGQYTYTNGLMIKGMLDAYGGQVSGTSFDFGAGYTLGRKKVHLRPQAIFSVGSYGLSLSYLKQNGSYIQVNEGQFYSDRVYVRLKAKHFTLSPQCEFGVQITPKYEILLNGGYNLGTSFKPFLKFTGSDENEESESATESISASNVTLLYEGERLKKSPIGMNGLFIHAGLAYHFR